MALEETKFDIQKQLNGYQQKLKHIHHRLGQYDKILTDNGWETFEDLKDAEVKDLTSVKVKQGHARKIYNHFHSPSPATDGLRHRFSKQSPRDVSYDYVSKSPSSTQLNLDYTALCRAQTYVFVVTAIMLGNFIFFVGATYSAVFADKSYPEHAINECIIWIVSAFGIISWIFITTNCFSCCCANEIGDNLGFANLSVGHICCKSIDPLQYEQLMLLGRSTMFLGTLEIYHDFHGDLSRFSLIIYASYALLEFSFAIYEQCNAVNQGERDIIWKEALDRKKYKEPSIDEMNEMEPLNRSENAGNPTFTINTIDGLS